MKLKFAVLFVLFALLCASGADAATICYVKAGGTGDGTSWANASGDLRGILDQLPNEGNDVEIWVASGNYELTGAKETFMLKKGVKLYGGFAGTESSVEERDVKTNATTLNGNKKATHVVTGGRGATPDDTRIDGFVITGGIPPEAAEYRDRESKGGGMYNEDSSPTIANCSFWQNIAEHGGGIYNKESSPVITNCHFSENTANSVGGGMVNFQKSSPIITSCVFSDNISGSNGAGMFNSHESSPVIEKSAFTGNKTPQNGGGMANVEVSSPKITECTFSGNTAEWGGGMYNSMGVFVRGDSIPIITKCVFEKNTAIKNGGGIQNASTEAIIIDCIFSNNKPKDINKSNG